MKKCFLLLMFLLSNCVIYAQEITYTKEQIQVKLDSIREEANILFRLESASWKTTDLINEIGIDYKKLGGYTSYISNDSVKTIFVSKEKDMVMAEVVFVEEFEDPVVEKLLPRSLKKNEEELFLVRDRLIDQLMTKDYGITIPNGYNFNFITIPFGSFYKTYMILGSEDAKIIPFGNDFMFVTDNKGEIISHQRFHMSFIPAQTAFEDKVITRCMHSHVKSSPFISATDICTFKLYAPFSSITSFSVYSSALDMTFVYDLKTDLISVEISD